MHNPESVLENETHIVLWDFEIRTDHLISASRPDYMIVNPPTPKKRRKKRTCWIVDLAIPADHSVKLKESEKKDKYLDFARELKNYETWK